MSLAQRVGPIDKGVVFVFAARLRLGYGFSSTLS